MDDIKYKEIWMVIEKETYPNDNRHTERHTLFEDRDDAYGYVSKQMQLYIQEEDFEFIPFTFENYECNHNGFPTLIHKEDSEHPQVEITWSIYNKILFLKNDNER